MNRLTIVITTASVVAATNPNQIGATQLQDSTPRRRPATLPLVQVIGGQSALGRVPGSAAVLDARQLQAIRPRDAGEALRSVPGVFPREEEGLGLRPNISIRGLNPTRSSKVLLLEDGIPFTIAPYGDNATYYHPPIDRFDRIEILKGSGQILYGPQTIGGVINYLTPEISGGWTGRLTTTTGNRGYLNLAGRGEAAIGPATVRIDLLRKQGAGARDNVGSRLTDLGAKVVTRLGRDQALTWRAGYYSERSRVTYSGLTEAEFAAAPRQNPFRNDSMFLDRWATSAAHRISLSDRAAITTTAYGYLVSRDWWRQSSNSGQRPNDGSDPGCGGLVNLSTTCGNEGRLRDYAVWGIEPRLRAQYQLGSIPVVADLGFRFHGERQERRQVNGDSPNARAVGLATNPNSGLKEDNLRANLAYSGYLQQRLQVGRLGITPGIRAEHVRFRRTNRLPTEPLTGRTQLTAIIPGLGLAWLPADPITLFAGVHRGFAPPRTEDLIDNAGKTVELEAETSWNYEAGVRASLGRGGRLEATLFRMDFGNQVIPSSLAGGAGATLTSAGATRHLGLELAANANLARVLGGLHLEVGFAYTYLPIARFEGERFVFVGTTGEDGIGEVFAGQNGGGTRERVSVTGRRLPYAPTHLLTASVAVVPRAGSRVRVEVVGSSRMFGDALNTTTLSADGQQGRLASYAVWNATVAQELQPLRLELFLAIKNLFDRTYVVDRSRGILPGLPRTVSLGATRSF